MWAFAVSRTLIDPHALFEKIGVRRGFFLDLACGGHGHFTVPAAQTLQSVGAVYAVDIDHRALAALQSRSQESGLANIVLVHGNLEAEQGVPLSDEFGDVALLANALSSFAAPLSVFREIQRLLKIGGLLCLVAPKPASPFYGLARTKEISEDTAIAFAEAAGFALERRFDAGRYHYASILQRIR